MRLNDAVSDFTKLLIHTRKIDQLIITAKTEK
jgi:hypothetical protein